MNCSFFSSALIIALGLSNASVPKSCPLLITTLLVGVFAFAPVASVEDKVQVIKELNGGGDDEVASATSTASQQCLESGDDTCGAENSDQSSSSSLSSSSSSDQQLLQEESQSTTTIITNPDGHTLISHSELASHITIENRIWLSILGKVYDVTEGDSFYGFTKGSYKFYAGRDASPCFATGNNTPEGADEKLEEWTENSKVIGVYEWAIFYENHEKYKFVGVLADSRYYDSNGVETSLRRDFISRASAAKEIADAEREKKRKERMEAKLERRKKLYG